MRRPLASEVRLDLAGGRTRWLSTGHGRSQALDIPGSSIGRRVEDARRVSLPRPVLPSSFYLLTRRCTQRQFLLRPDAETNNAYVYCLLVAALRFGIDVMLMCAMSNHHHVVVFDRVGRYPEFIEHFHKLLARSQNALRGRWENFWAAGQTSVVRLVDAEDVLAKLVYVATNPVKDGLVERVHHWPGINGYRALITGKLLRATRSRHFFRADGPMPATVEARLSLPPELGDTTAFLQRLEEQVTAFEETAKQERVRSMRGVVGRRTILRQSWKDSPRSFEPRRVLSPRIAARNLWSRVEALIKINAFVRAYQAARAAWRDGLAVEFPVGTYWLRRFANVPIAAQ